MHHTGGNAMSEDYAVLGTELVLKPEGSLAKPALSWLSLRPLFHTLAGDEIPQTRPVTTTRSRGPDSGFWKVKTLLVTSRNPQSSTSRCM